MQDDINATQAAPGDDSAALGAAEAQLAVLRTQQQNEIKAILSGDQVQTWNEFPSETRHQDPESNQHINPTRVLVPIRRLVSHKG